MTYSAVVIVTVRNGNIVVAGSDQLCLPFIFADLSKKTLFGNALDVVKAVTGVEAYDPETGLGWLIVNEFGSEETFVFEDFDYHIHYTLMPEAIKLSDSYRWFELSQLVGFREVELDIVRGVLKLL